MRPQGKLVKGLQGRAFFSNRRAAQEETVPLLLLNGPPVKCNNSAEEGPGEGEGKTRD